MTIASWLLVVEPDRLGTVRTALGVQPGIECRSHRHGTLVVVTESPSGQGLESLHETLRSVAGVRDTALVAAFEEEGEP